MLQGGSSTGPSKTKILLVDDDEAIVRALARAFRDQHEVLTANGGQQGLAVLEQHPDVAVVLSDFSMPGLDGVAFLRRTLALAPRATRILTSGLGELSAFREAIDECQLYTFVAKPFDLDAVLIIVQRAAEHHVLVEKNHGLVAELAERAAREEALRRAFQQYVPAEVINDLVEHGGPASLVGLERDVTILLADLRGFTTFAERRPPGEVVLVLNRFFEAMARPLLAHGGTIDKYVGDSILAHFGGLHPTRSAATDAVRAALAMRSALRALDEELRIEGLPSLHFGVGINTGRCILGNVGCAARMDYTIIGDAVNVAARVEELTKHKLDAVLITESTRLALEDDFELVAWAPVSIRGREQPVAVFEVVDANA